MLIVLVVLIILLIGVVLIALFRKPASQEHLSTPLQNLNQSVQQSQATLAVVSEKLAGLTSVPDKISAAQTELARLAERISSVETNQGDIDRAVKTLANGISTTGTLTEGIVQSTNAIREEISRAKNDLTALQTQTTARQVIEQKTAKSIERLETIIAGTQSKGKAGENILDFVFAKLPAEWQIRNLQIRNGVVEFALRLPNDLALPIDSKWTATNLIEQYERCDDADEQKRLKGKIEEAVLKKAKEVERYIDPNRTASFAIAAVPDPVFSLCAAVSLEAFQRNVVLISYSMFLPYLMLVFQTMLKSSQNIDREKLTPYLEAAQKSIQTLQEELDGRMARAITMLGNSRNEMSVTLSTLGSGLTGLQISSGVAAVVLASSTPELPDSVMAVAASVTKDPSL